LSTVSKESRNGNARHPISARIVDFGQVGELIVQGSSA
jgi:hypothetical protein